MSDFNSLVVKGGLPRTVEIDPSCHSVYIRFKTAKVHKTISRDSRGTIVAVDLDAGNEVIGIELVGVKEVSIEAIRHHLPSQLRQANFERARFMPVTDVPCQQGTEPVTA